MSLWRRILGQGGGAARSETNDFWYQQIGGLSSAGVNVTHESAIRLSVVLACVRVLGESIGSLPLGMFRRLPNGDKESQPDHPLYDLLHDRANDEHTAVEFREMMAAHAALRGTAYAEIIPGRRGPVDQLIPIHPDEIRPVKVRAEGQDRASWQYEVRRTGEPTRRLLRSELFIVRALAISRDTPEGIDPIMHEAESIGTGLAAARYGASFFANDARPSGVLKHPGTFKDEQSRNMFVKAWRRAFGAGGRRHGTAVLEHGMEYQQLGVTPEQAQFLETRKYSDVEIARIFRVPPHMVGILDRATWSNMEQQALEFVTYTLTPWLVRWEQAIKRDLITGRQFFAEHNVAALLRGDTAARFQAYSTARQWGWLSVNEIRRMENMNRIDNGDDYLQPLNMVPAGQQPTAPTDRTPPRRNGAELNGHDNEGTLWTPH